jgi:heat-inducible transcriptional repressor
VKTQRGRSRTLRPAARRGALDERRRSVLRAVVEEYVATAAPVGSQAIVERYRLGVSSATVRNVMAELERAALITQPHTSAGRVPSDAGYRVYVESIADPVPLPPVDQLRIRHQFGQVALSSEQWFRLAAAILASTTRAAGLVTAVRPGRARVRRIDVASVQPRLAALVLVPMEGSLHQALVELPADADQAALDAAAERLDGLLRGRTAAQVEQASSRLDPLGAAVARRVAELLRERDGDHVEDLFSDGLLNVMATPEFARTEKLRQVFAALQDRAYLGRLVERVGRTEGVRVFIGRENLVAEMRDVSLVLAPFGHRSRTLGIVGVLGPTRMPYPRAIGAVGYVSGLMNELVGQLYA